MTRTSFIYQQHASLIICPLETVVSPAIFSQITRDLAKRKDERLASKSYEKVDKTAGTHQEKNSICTDDIFCYLIELI